MAQELKKVYFNGRNWFIDYRLKEIRDTNNPHNNISFESIAHLFDEIMDV